MICKDGVCAKPNFRCVTSSVLDIWTKAGFQDYTIKGSTVRDRIISLHSKYLKLNSMKTLNWNSSKDTFTKIQADFVDESNRLFDISVANVEAKIGADRLRCKEAKEEDILFLQDQRNDRKMYITEELDHDFEKSVKSKIERHQKLMKAKETEQEKLEKQFENNELEISIDSESTHSFSSDTLTSLPSGSEDSPEKPTYSKNNPKSQVYINITAEELVECTSAVAARYNVGIRPQTSFIAAVCNKSGVNLDDVALSRATVHRKRYKKVEELGDQIRQDVMNTLKGKKLCLHFDGKQVKEVEEKMNIVVSVERISISVTSPDIEDSDDILLGVVQAESSKGCDQAEVILSLLEYYDIADQIYAVCCDTTASNTGAFSGAITLLSSILNVPLLWFLCRRHMLEVHISHFMEALTGEKTKGPRRGLYTRLQKSWPNIMQEMDKSKLIRFNWSKLQTGSPLFEITREALEYGQRALKLGLFARGDYRKLCELVVYYLGGDVPDFHFHQPGACHEARFMADALYLLTLRMTDNIAKVMNEEERNMVETASFFVASCYSPWFLKSYIVEKSTNNDIKAFYDVFEIRKEYPKLGQSLLDSMQRHSWYLTEQLIMIAIADDDVDEEYKTKMMKKLLEFEVPDSFIMGKPRLPIITVSTELVQLIGPQSWILLKVADIPAEEVTKWIHGEAQESLDKFKMFVKGNTCVNDCSERNIRLIQDFVAGYKNEDMKQNLLLVARDNRKKLKKDLLKDQLKNV